MPQRASSSAGSRSGASDRRTSASAAIFLIKSSTSVQFWRGKHPSKQAWASPLAQLRGSSRGRRSRRGGGGARCPVGTEPSRSRNRLTIWSDLVRLDGIGSKRRLGRSTEAAGETRPPRGAAGRAPRGLGNPVNIRTHGSRRKLADCGVSAHDPAHAGREGAENCAPGRARSLMRLSRRVDKAVEVRFCAVKNRAVSNRNCVAVRRGGEQRNENDQSVTQAVRVASRRELDSVGVDGRVCERKTKPAKRAIGEEPNRRAAGWSPVVALMVGDRMVGSPSAVIRETRRGQAGVHGQEGPKSRPAGVRASAVVTEAGNGTVEREGTQESGRMTDGMTDNKPARVPRKWLIQQWHPPSAIDLADTVERSEGHRPWGRGEEPLPLNRAPTDWKAGCGKSARPVWREGWRESAIPTPIPLPPGFQGSQSNQIKPVPGWGRLVPTSNLSAPPQFPRRQAQSDQIKPNQPGLSRRRNCSETFPSPRGLLHFAVHASANRSGCRPDAARQARRPHGFHRIGAKIPAARHQFHPPLPAR